MHAGVMMANGETVKPKTNKTPCSTSTSLTLWQFIRRENDFPRFSYYYATPTFFVSSSAHMHTHKHTGTGLCHTEWNSSRFTCATDCAEFRFFTVFRNLQTPTRVHVAVSILLACRRRQTREGANELVYRRQIETCSRIHEGKLNCLFLMFASIPGLITRMNCVACVFVGGCLCRQTS